MNKNEYKYYYLDKNNVEQELRTTSHFLNATEIAEYLGIVTLNNKINSKIIRVIVDQYNPNKYKYFYKESYHPMRVYDLGTIARLIGIISYKAKKEKDVMTICDKKFKLKEDGILSRYIKAYNYD